MLHVTCKKATEVFKFLHKGLIGPHLEYSMLFSLLLYVDLGNKVEHRIPTHAYSINDTNFKEGLKLP